MQITCGNIMSSAKVRSPLKDFVILGTSSAALQAIWKRWNMETVFQSINNFEMQKYIGWRRFDANCELFFTDKLQDPLQTLDTNKFKGNKGLKIRIISFLFFLIFLVVI